ncbi:unnamed protein product, partial [Auanema sp. JU1783]
LDAFDGQLPDVELKHEPQDLQHGNGQMGKLSDETYEKVHNLQVTINELREELETLRPTVHGLRDELETLRIIADEREEEIGRLRPIADEREEEIGRLRPIADEREEEIGRLRPIADEREEELLENEDNYDLDAFDGQLPDVELKHEPQDLQHGN